MDGLHWNRISYCEGIELMFQLRARPIVQEYYPDAIESSQLVEAFLRFTESTLGIGAEDIAFLSSVCSDDLNSVQLPSHGMVGPFTQGGLDGYPFVGKTGIGAFSHHLPDCGAALMFVAPHVGITHDGQVGMIFRPRQSEATTCCGAGAAALKKLEEGKITPKDPKCFAFDDYQQETLEQILLRHSNEILHLGKPGYAWRFVRMSEVVYRESIEAFFNLLKSVEFHNPAFVFGGILINKDGDEGADIALRHAIRVDNGEFIDMTDDFREWAEEKFQMIEKGDKDALRRREP